MWMRQSGDARYIVASGIHNLSIALAEETEDVKVAAFVSHRCAGVNGVNHAVALIDCEYFVIGKFGRLYPPR